MRRYRKILLKRKHLQTHAAHPNVFYMKLTVRRLERNAWTAKLNSCETSISVLEITMSKKYFGAQIDSGVARSNFSFNCDMLSPAVVEISAEVLPTPSIEFWWNEVNDNNASTSHKRSTYVQRKPADLSLLKPQTYFTFSEAKRDTSCLKTLLVSLPSVQTSRTRPIGLSSQSDLEARSVGTKIKKIP